MAITIADVVSPAGEIDRLVLFPDEIEAVFDERIEGYIDDAVARASAGDLTDQDDADEFAFHWVHYRARRDAWLKAILRPSSAELPDSGKFSFSKDQRDMLETAWKDDLAQANAILLPASGSGWGSALVLRGS